MPSSKGLGILMEDQLAWKITTVKHNALSLTSRSMVCHAIPLASLQSLLQTPSSHDAGKKKSFKNPLVYPIYFSYEMAACLRGMTRLEHGWKGYEASKGQAWDCWRMEKGLLDAQPLPPTLHLIPCNWMHFPNYQVCTVINSLVTVDSTILSLLQSMPNGAGDGTSTQSPAPLRSTPRPPSSSPNWSNLCSPQSAEELCAVPLFQTYPHGDYSQAHRVSTHLKRPGIHPLCFLACS